MIRGNLYPDGELVTSMNLDGGAFVDSLLLTIGLHIEINGVGTPPGAVVTTWAARDISPDDIGYGLLIADDGDTFEIVNSLHPGPVKMWIYRSTSLSDPLTLVDTLAIAPGQTRSGAITLSRDPDESFYTRISLPDQPLAGP